MPLYSVVHAVVLQCDFGDSMHMDLHCVHASIETNILSGVAPDRL